MATTQSSNRTQNKQSNNNAERNRGFAPMSPDKQQDAGSKGSQTNQQRSTSQKPNPDEARLTSSKATDNSRKTSVGPDTSSGDYEKGGAYDLPVQPRQSGKNH